MSSDNQLTTNFIDSDGIDVGKKYVTKSYLMDVYPYLQDVGIKMPGLWLVGDNIYGQLGDSTTTERSSPVQTICGGTNWKQVAAGYAYTAAIKTDGTLWAWGYNILGQLGDSTTTDKSSPVQTIAGGTNWKQVATGYAHTAAIKTDGTLWLWGYNEYGQLGDSTIASKLSPVQTICGGTNWKQVAVGGGHYTAAIKTDGTLWTWGYNYYAQLGDSTRTDRSSPVQTIAGGTNWKQVATGYYHTAAIKTDGTLWTCGYNGYGQLGDSTTTERSSPVQTIAGGTNWKQISCCFLNTAAIKTDGTLWAWGYNEYGELGDGTTTNRSSPVQTIAGGTNWKQVSCGFGYIAAIKTDGTLWTPNIIFSGTNWKQVATGLGYIAAITEMGDDF
jgi:alpha-tubulin suppressor-like RCC1 family protein